MSKLNLEDVKDILTEQFARVGRSFDRSLEYSSEWYTETTWTKEEQEDFEKWLVNHLRTKFKQSKRQSTSGAAWFILMYGWRLSE